MNGRLAEESRDQVWDYVEAFEAAQAPGERADLGGYLPASDHPHFLPILCELVRVELELRWTRGERPDLQEYRDRYPDLFLDARLAAEVGFEDDRLRRQADEPAATPRLPYPEKPVARAAPSSRDPWPGRRIGTDGASADSRLPAEHGDLFRDLHRTDPGTAGRLAQAVSNWPEVGSDFLGFHLDSELGRGAFGRVFLARQGELADRPVALKIAPDIAGESRALAQLQHTNVVPIFSIHRGGVFQAVCMPYLGSTTLADVIAELGRRDTLPDSGEVLLSTIDSHRAASTPKTEVHATLNGAAAGDSIEAGSNADALPAHRWSPQVERLRGLGYVESVLWIARRLADGLAHAHERGIVHRDLKPANVLFADDGEPMLLDFNLAVDTKSLGQATVALVGGTLPFMAPEQLDAFRGANREVDARADLYALGVILFQILAGRLPFEVRRGSVDEVIPRMIDDRRGPPPGVRQFNKAASPAVEAIVRRLLEFDPARRYATARHLEEDLRRQLDDLPLLHTPEPSPRERVGKWMRRHPRLTSTTSVGLVAVVLATGLGSGLWARNRQVARLEAVGAARLIGEDRRRAEILLPTRDVSHAQREEGIALCREAVDRYEVLTSSHWIEGARVAPLDALDRRQLRRNVGDLLYFWARGVSWQASIAGADQRSSILKEATRLVESAEAAYPPGEVPRALWTLRADLARLDGRDDEAKRYADRASATPLASPSDRLLEAGEKISRGRFGDALPYLLESIRIEPGDVRAWLLMAEGHSSLKRFDEARRCYDVVISLRPDLPWPYFGRGLVGLDAKRYAEAEADFDRVLQLRPREVESRVNRALARLRRDDARGAIDDLSNVLARRDPPTRAYFIRAAARDRAGDREGAGRDREEGQKQTPQDDLGWVARGLSRLPRDPKGALADMEQALRLDPRSFPALQDKAAILSDYLGRTEEAVKVLDAATGLYPDAVTSRAGRGVLLARLGRRDAAHEDARIAQRLDSGAATLYQVAGIYALTSRTHPQDLKEALRLLAAAIGQAPEWLKTIPRDPDLDPIRDRPEFRKLVEALGVVGD